MGWNVQTVEARARWWALVPSCCVSSSVTTWTGDDIKVDSLKENQGARTRRRKNGNKASQKILQVPTYSGNKGKRTHQARESNHPDNRNRTCSYHGKQGKRVSRKRGMPKVSYIANIKENSIKRKKTLCIQWSSVALEEPLEMSHGHAVHVPWNYGWSWWREDESNRQRCFSRSLAVYGRNEIKCLRRDFLKRGNWIYL